MEVRHTAFLNKAVFKGGAEFKLLKTGGNIEVTGAKFLNPDKDVYFNA